MSAARRPADDRRREILAAAYAAADELGYNLLTRKAVSERMGVTAPLVNHYYGDLDGLRAAVMVEAVRRGNLRIIAQGLVTGDKVAGRAPVALRRKALAAYR